MKKHFLYKQACCLVLLLVFFSSCSGQGKNGVHDKPNKNSVGQPKMIKTQGTNAYNAVACGLQDRAGNLWFGAGGEGLYRYDGKSFINFTEKDGLCNNNVVCMLEDRTGKLWLGTNAGLCCYDRKSFTSFPILNNGSNFFAFSGKTAVASHSGVWSLLQDKTGKIWISTYDDGVYCYDGGYFTHFLHDDGVINDSRLRLNAVKSIIEDKNGNIWFATWFEGVCRYDGRSITSFKPNGEVWFDALLEDKAGNLWIGRRSHGVFRYDGKTFADFFADVKIFNACCVYAMAEDKAGNIWFASEFDDLVTRDDFGGVWRYDLSASLKTGSKVMTDFTTKDGLSHNSVFSVTIDRSGILWFGTRGMGLSRYDGKTFTEFVEKGSKQ